MVEKTPDVTLGEVRAALAEQGIGAGVATLWRFFARWRITLKKTAHACEQDRPDILTHREAWFEGKPDLDPQKPVFIEETAGSMGGPRAASDWEPVCHMGIGTTTPPPPSSAPDAGRA
jgi:hypothetical protein